MIRFLTLLLLIVAPLVGQTDDYQFIYPMLHTSNGSGNFLTETEPLTSASSGGIGQLFFAQSGSCQIDDVHFWITTVTTAQSLDVRIEDIGSDGLGDGTADATCTIASPATGPNTCNYGTPATKTQGTVFSVYVDWTSTTGDIDFTSIASDDEFLNNRYLIRENGTSRARNGALAMALKCSDGRWLKQSNVGGSFVGRQLTTDVYAMDSADTPDEIANEIVTGLHDMTVDGACWIARASGGKTFELDVVDTSGTSLCAGGDGCGTHDTSAEALSSVLIWNCTPFDETITLSASTTYYASIRATDSVTNNNITVAYIESTNALLGTFGPNFSGGASRTDQGSWTTGATACFSGGPNCNDIIPMIFLQVSGLQDPGTGTTTSHGSVQ